MASVKRALPARSRSRKAHLCLILSVSFQFFSTLVLLSGPAEDEDFENIATDQCLFVLFKAVSNSLAHLCYLLALHGLSNIFIVYSILSSPQNGGGRIARAKY